MAEEDFQAPPEGDKPKGAWIVICAFLIIGGLLVWQAGSWFYDRYHSANTVSKQPLPTSSTTVYHPKRTIDVGIILSDGALARLIFNCVMAEPQKLDHLGKFLSPDDLISNRLKSHLTRGFENWDVDDCLIIANRNQKLDAVLGEVFKELRMYDGIFLKSILLESWQFDHKTTALLDAKREALSARLRAEQQVERALAERKVREVEMVMKREAELAYTEIQIKKELMRKEAGLPPLPPKREQEYPDLSKIHEMYAEQLAELNEEIKRLKEAGVDTKPLEEATFIGVVP